MPKRQYGPPNTWMKSASAKTVIGEQTVRQTASPTPTLTPASASKFSSAVKEKVPLSGSGPVELNDLKEFQPDAVVYRTPASKLQVLSNPLIGTQPTLPAAAAEARTTRLGLIR